MTILTSHEYELFNQASGSSIELPDGDFAGEAQPNTGMGTQMLVDCASYRAHLITAHGKRQLMIATAYAPGQRAAHTRYLPAHGYTDTECERVATAVGLDIGRRVLEESARAA